MTLAEILRAEGRNKGLEKGMERGMEKGMALGSKNSKILVLLFHNIPISRCIRT